MLALMADVLAIESLIVGSLGDGRELLTEAERFHPDVIVLYITMLHLDGIAAAPTPALAPALRRGGLSSSSSSLVRATGLSTSKRLNTI
jgi:CheY-like chemotaxis protein